MEYYAALKRIHRKMTQNDVHKIFLIKKNFVILTQGHSLLILERGEGRERKEGQKH